MMPEPLNELERRVLDYVVEYLRTNTYQPSIREIGREFAIRSTKTVSELLQSLADKGWIERDPSRSRGVRVLGLERQPGTVSLPIVRADMMPHGGYLELDRRLVDGPGSFLMSMNGEYLGDEGIRAGDLLLVEPVGASTLDAGDLVVVRTGDATAVRRVATANPRILLAPADAGEPPLELTGTQAAALLQGRVGGVVRRLRPTAADAAADAATRATPVPA
jgi:repressor LexA